MPAPNGRATLTLDERVLMARVTVEDCLDSIDNRFALSILAAKRARQLRKGTPSLVDAPGNKESVVALREIAAGRVTFDTDLTALLEGDEDS